MRKNANSLCCRTKLNQYMSIIYKRVFCVNNFQLLNRKVHIEWHKHKWDNTFLGMEQINWLAQKFFLYYLLIPRKVNDPAHRAQRILSKHPTPGGVLFTKVKHQHLRKTPDKGLADVLTFWVSDLFDSSFKTRVDLMLTLSFIFGAIAFWQNAPRQLLEVDPSLILDPSRLHLLKEIIINNGCLPQDEKLICTGIEFYNNELAEEFKQESLMTTEAMRAKNRTVALAITVTSFVIVFMLNSVSISHGL